MIEDWLAINCFFPDCHKRKNKYVCMRSASLFEVVGETTFIHYNNNKAPVCFTQQSMPFEAACASSRQYITKHKLYSFLFL